MNEVNQNPVDILLVEDNEADIKITLRAFAKAKLANNIFVVHNGEEAINFLEHKDQYSDSKKFPIPDLILLDIQMPKLNGFEVLKYVKSQTGFDIIPIIMLTSSKNEEDIVNSYKYGAVSYIQKPVTYEAFEYVVDGFNFYWHIINKLPPKQNR